MKRFMWSIIPHPLGCFVVLLGLCVNPAAAADYPSRALRLIVPYGAGGSYDLIARLMAQKLSEQLGHQVVVDNRPGAAGRIGMDIAVKSAPDGYNLIVIGNTQVIAPIVYGKAPYDIHRDINPLSTVATITNTLVVNPSLPVKSVSELVALTKSKPNSVQYGSGGTGGITHLAGELFKSMSGADITHVPYKAGALATNAAVGGEVQMVFLNAFSAIPHIQTNKLRGLAVTGSKRSPYLPSLPTLDEAGLKGYELVEFHGLAVPRGAPAAVVKRLNAEIATALTALDLREKLVQQAAEPAPSSPEEFAAMLKVEHDKYARIVSAVGIKAE